MLGEWGGGERTPRPNISVHHVINISDRIAIFAELSANNFRPKMPGLIRHPEAFSRWPPPGPEG